MTGRLWQYIKIEYKRTACSFFNAGRSLILMMAAVTLCSYGSAYVLYKLNLYKPVRVGIVVKDRDRELDMAVRFIESMETVREISEISEVTENEAHERIAKGDLDAAIILPENFYVDINTGINTPARVLLSSESTDKGSELWKEFLEDGTALIDVSEAGIYATSFAAGECDLRIEKREMEIFLTRLFAETVFRRERFFTDDFNSPFGELDIVHYYLVVTMAAVVLFTGFYFRYLYRNKGRMVEKKLKSYRIGPIKTGLVRVLVMSSTLAAIVIALRLISYAVIDRAGLRSVAVGKTDIEGIILVSICAAAFFHFMYNLGRHSGASMFIMFLADMVMLFLGGTLLPLAFYPEWLKSISRFLPLTVWQSLLAEGMLSSVSIFSTALVAFYTIVFWGAGVSLECKNI